MDASSVRTTEPQRLPSGRHKLPREEVVTSQRGRMQFAMVQAVAEKGYQAVTVADVVERASVSRRTFYEQFEGKEDCFLAAYETGMEIVLSRLRKAAEGLEKQGWEARIRSQLETYMRVLADEPEFAWSLHVEVLAAGPAVLERRAQIFALFSERTRRLHAEAIRDGGGVAELEPTAFAFQTGGIDELIRECLRTEGAKALPELAAPAAIAATLALFRLR